LYGDRFHSVDLDHFCREPESVVREIYGALGLSTPALDSSRVHPAKGPYESDSPNRKKYKDLLGIPDL
jgi:hypothetical protein